MMVLIFTEIIQIQHVYHLTNYYTHLGLISGAVSILLVLILMIAHLCQRIIEN